MVQWITLHHNVIAVIGFATKTNDAGILASKPFLKESLHLNKAGQHPIMQNSYWTVIMGSRSRSAVNQLQLIVWS